MNSLIRLIESFYCTPWAMLPSHLKALESMLLSAYRQKDTAALEAEAANISARSVKTIAPSNGIGVIPVLGPIGHRASFISDYFGWPTTERIGQTYEQMVNDSSISAIIFDIDSPGGSAVGNQELHQLITKSRDKKPVIAVANGMAASAAYFMASAANEIVVIPSGEVGSIGTVMVHADYSKMFEEAGITVTVIKAGEYKWEGHPYEPLSEEAKTEFQRQVDAHYDIFLKAVAKGRNTSVQTVRNDYGQGRMLMAKDALKAGMADKVATFEETLARFGGTRSGASMRNEAGETGVLSLDLLRLRNRQLSI